jgi:hypothetical protein
VFEFFFSQLGSVRNGKHGFASSQRALSTELSGAQWGFSCASIQLPYVATVDASTMRRHNFENRSYASCVCVCVFVFVIRQLFVFTWSINCLCLRDPSMRSFGFHRVSSVNCRVCIFCVRVCLSASLFVFSIIHLLQRVKRKWDVDVFNQNK